MNKKKIIFYIDWTDCLAHLTGDEAYQEGETEEQRNQYTRNQVNHFFYALEKLQEKYDVDIHCVTGGTIEYLNGDGHGWISLLHELFENAGFPNTFQSVVTEYGADLLIGKDSSILERPFEDSKILCTNHLLNQIENTIPSEIKSMVELSLCKYFANVSFEKEDMTQQEFEYYYDLIKEFQNNELYSLYPYYCPGYGVEIDVLPKGLDKARGVDSINSIFYQNVPTENIALSLFNGDFAQIDLRMIDHSLTEDVLFVASVDADIKPYVSNTSLSYQIGGYKIEALTKAMEEISTKDLEKHPYIKKDYRYTK